MSKSSQFLRNSGIFAVVIAAGVLAGWVVSRPPARISLTHRSPAPMANASTPPEAAGQSARSVRNLPPEQPGLSRANTLVTNWEERVEDILGSSSTDASKAQSLLELLPRCPADDQATLIRPLSNLVPDRDFSLLGGYLTNATLSARALEILVRSILSRPNSLKLPWLLAVASQEHNPESSQAQEWLKVFLEVDFGKDWPKWQTKLDQWLRDNPD